MEDELKRKLEKDLVYAMKSGTYRDGAINGGIYRSILKQVERLVDTSTRIAVLGARIEELEHVYAGNDGTACTDIGNIERSIYERLDDLKSNNEGVKE